MATPADSESAEDDHISRIIDADGDSPDPSGSFDDQSPLGDEVDDRVSRLAELSLTGRS